MKIDQDSLRGHGVEVLGRLVSMGEVALLRFHDMDPSPIFVEVRAVPRGQRRALLERCEMSGCDVTILGRVAAVLAHPGVVADSIEIR